MRKIVGNLYRIGNTRTGIYEVIECMNKEELIRYIASISDKKLIDSVVLLDVSNNGVRTPKVAVKSDSLYIELTKIRK